MNKHLKSFIYAFKGIWKVISCETNMKIDLFIGSVVIAMGLVFELSTIEWLFVTISIGLVLVAETFNTAIERICNMIEQRYNKNIGTIKDIAAGAVLICAITAAIIGITVFLPKVITLFFENKVAL